MWLVGLSTMIIAMGVTWIVTPGVLRLATSLGALDLPAARKAHATPTPRIGGLAVFLGFVAGLAFAAHVTGTLTNIPGASGVYWKGLAIAATGLMVVGLVDDLHSLSFQWKFAAQLVAAMYVWQCGFRIELVTHPLGGVIELGSLSLPLTVLWIVGITNAVNLIDGLDGLASGLALITTLSVAVIAFAGGHLGMTAASVALAGSLVGFLRYNFNPAQIFLGDSGSMFLGFVLAVTSVRGSPKGPTVVAIFVPLLVLGLPLLDTTLAVARRIYRLGHRGRRTESNVMRYVLLNFHQVFMPDRGHIHHKLLDLGLTHRGAVLALYAVSGLFALAAFTLVLVKSLWVAALLGGVLAVLMAGLVILLYFRIRGAKRRGEVSSSAAPVDVNSGQTARSETLAVSSGQR
jgi:UDP-GlcNAc:undecaprenyl-phosphate GlcNAc-1-phosphate transferase